MGKVTSDISMSLDGFITDPNAGVGNALGDDPGRLHDWMFDAKRETDAAIGFARPGSDVPLPVEEEARCKRDANEPRGAWQ